MHCAYVNMRKVYLIYKNDLNLGKPTQEDSRDSTITGSLIFNDARYREGFYNSHSPVSHL